MIRLNPYDLEFQFASKLILWSHSAGSGDEFAIISGDKDFYLGYCSRSSVIEVAQGVGRARALLFDGPTEVKYIDDFGAAVSLPSRSLLKEALNFKTCPLKVGW